MLFIIIGIIGGLIVCSTISFIITVIFWETDVCETAPRISYDAFVKWYKVTPKERWRLEDTYVRFYTKKYDPCRYAWSGNEYHSPITIEFKSYLDVLKYKRLRKKWGVMEKEMEKQEKTALLLKCVQEEINNFEKENQAEMRRLLKQEEEQNISYLPIKHSYEEQHISCLPIKHLY